MGRNGSLSEEEKMRMVPGIVYVDGVIGRRAHIVGTGLDVFELIKAYRIYDDDDQSFIDSYNGWLSPEQVKAGIEFYRQFPEEIDERLAIEDSVTPEEVWALVEARYGSSALKKSK